MICVVFDTNYFLAKILREHIWSKVVEESLQEVDELFKQKKIEVRICKKITDEIEGKVTQIANYLNKIFIDLKNSLPQKNQAFTKDTITKLRLEMDTLIRNEPDLTKKNQLFHLESLILNEIKTNPGKIKTEILLTCSLFINNYSFELIAEVADYIMRYEMKSIELRPINQHEWDQIKTTIESSIRNNPSDVEILTTYVYYLEQNQLEGIFITHDFKDFLINSIALEGAYPRLKIIRPAYLKFYLN